MCADERMSEQTNEQNDKMIFESDSNTKKLRQTEIVPMWNMFEVLFGMEYILHIQAKP